ncbi:putative transposase [Acidiphilium sp. MT5]
MAKPYSMDFHERVVGAVLTGGMSTRAAAERFGVSNSSAIKWVRRQRETGSVAPSQIGGHKPRLLTGALHDWLITRAARDFTLRGLVAELFAEFGVEVDYVQVWRLVHQKRLSFKKKRSSGRAATAKGRSTSRVVAEISKADRSRTFGFCRRDLGKNQYGTVARLGASR